MREIDKAHYCTGGFYSPDHCWYPQEGISKKCIKAECATFCCHKWETPAQYKERMGEDWSDDNAVYCGYISNNSKYVRWLSPLYFWEAKDSMEEHPDVQWVVLCANTDWGKPPDDWMPE
jgi:hypothetical protein